MNVLLAATGALAFAPTAFCQSTPFAGAASERQPRPLVELIPVSARANTVRNTGSKIYFAALEAGSGSSDLDGDGDATDIAPSIFDPATGTLTHIPYDAVVFHVGKGFLALLRDEADSATSTAMATPPIESSGSTTLRPGRWITFRAAATSWASTTPAAPS